MTSNPKESYKQELFKDEKEEMRSLLIEEDKHLTSNETSLSIREKLGDTIRNLQMKMDANLSLVRMGCVLVMIGSTIAAVRFSGLLNRFNRVEEIPVSYFTQRKQLRVRVIRQSSTDPHILYFYHTPWLRRWLLNDDLPPFLETLDPQNKKNLLAVRPFGIQVDESATPWIYANYVSSHRYVNIELLHRLCYEDDINLDQVATCGISIRKPLYNDFAEELVSHGLAQVLDVAVDAVEDQASVGMETLRRRLDRLHACQIKAQSMRYGIWKDWKEPKWKDRVLSASKRVTVNGLKQIVGKISSSSS